MSNVLMIRHLPITLSIKEKEELLKHFGAVNVWESSKKRNYIFAAFPSIEKAKSALSRLHQLEISNRRLVVEYSLQKVPVATVQEIEQSSATTKHIQEFLKLLNAWSPSVDFYQPPPVHLKYKYPDISTNTVINIIDALYKHKPFYVQTLHLMNKMSLATPFIDNPQTLQTFKKNFNHYFVDEIPHIVINPESELESELSSGEEVKTHPVPKFKRKRKLPAPTKTAASILSTATLPKVRKTEKVQNQEEVFENTTQIQEPKKISVVVHQDALQQKPANEPEIVGELGKFHIEIEPEKTEKTPITQEQPTVTKKELLRNRISYRDMKVLNVFKNYHPGQPSMRLYIKNLAKTITEQDVKRIYRRYVEELSDEEQIGFDVRVMQEGRMKGQAFVTFPSLNIAETALHETNGYLLKDKPMVVQFARVANKKSID